MATRVYFPENADAPVTPPAPSGGAEWEHINSVVRALSLHPDTSALSTVQYAPDAADHLTNQDSHHRQYVSPPLAAQTISGNIKGQFQCLEQLANCNLFLTFKVLVCNHAGSSTQATLLAITRDTTNELGTALANRNFPSTALSSFACAAGDRIVLEIGLGGNITSGTGGNVGHNGSIRWGCDASGGDLPENDTETGTTFRPWVEFSNTLTFLPPEGGVGDEEQPSVAPRPVDFFSPKGLVVGLGALLLTSLAPAESPAINYDYPNPRPALSAPQAHVYTILPWLVPEHQVRGTSATLPTTARHRPPQQPFPNQTLLATTLAPEAPAETIPPGRQEWATPPQGPARSNELLTWIQNLVDTLPPGALPPGVQHWPGARAVPIQPPFPAQSLQATTLAPAVAAPFTPPDWPLPRAIVPRTQTHLQPGAPSGGAAPPRSFEYSNPQPARRALQAWAYDTRSTLLQVVQAQPFAQHDWPLPPRGALRSVALLTSLYSPLHTTLQIQVAKPPTSYNWPVPRRLTYLAKPLFHRPAQAITEPPVKPPATYDWSIPKRVTYPNRPTYHRPADVPAIPDMPVGQQAWTPPHFLQPGQLPRWLRNWPVDTESQPETNYNWPLPSRGPIRVPGNQTWIYNTFYTTLRIPAGKPFKQDDWTPPHLRRPTRSILLNTWTHNPLHTTLQIQPTKPAAQYDWPVPSAGPARSNALRTWIHNPFTTTLQVQPARPPFTPPATPLPPAGPARSVLLRTWTHNPLHTTLQIVSAKPFAQTQWPLPMGPRLQDRTWLRGPNVLQGILPAPPPTPVWPSSLPDILEVERYEEGPTRLRVRGSVGEDPPRMRRRSSYGVAPLRGQITCTKEQVATLDTFYVTTCASGAKAFRWTHSRTGQTVTLRFRTAPEYVPASPTLYRVALDFEIL